MSSLVMHGLKWCSIQLLNIQNTDLYILYLILMLLIIN